MIGAGTMNLSVLFENKHYIVINKPAGLVVHFDGKTKEPNVTDWVLEQYPETANVGEPLTLSSGEVIARPGIVHRIDRETSGALVIARTQEAFEYLKERFQSREVDKTYHAFVYGTVKKDSDTIDRPIGRSRKDFRMWSAQRFARGELREAITDYRVLARGESGEAVTFIEAKPHTGRTHQIRVHLKAINHPVVCDKLYAPKREPLLGFERLALHARSIQFEGIDGETVSVTAPYPADFEAAVAKIGAAV
jgi:23S rRNA pseudouridine1911/1915/1917 synthase